MVKTGFSPTASSLHYLPKKRLIHFGGIFATNDFAFPYFFAALALSARTLAII